MNDMKIKANENLVRCGKIASDETVFGKSIAGDMEISLGKSISRKSSGEKSFEVNSFGQNQSAKIVSEKIDCADKSPEKINCADLARIDSISDAHSGAPLSEPKIWLDTLSDEARKLLVHDGASKLHYVWAAMKQRCYNPKSRNYQWYGARGIKVCKSWLRWQNFKLWALRSGYDPEAPYGECTLDRIDVDGDYEPSNCRWVSLKEQMGNRQFHKTKLEPEPEPKSVSKYVKRPVVAVDFGGVEVYEFESVEAAARFFRPKRVSSASSYIQRAVDHGGTSYRYRWKYKLS